MKQLWWAIRAWFCEVLVGWSLRVCPRGYVPSYVELLAAAHLEKRKSTEGSLGAKSGRSPSHQYSDSRAR